MEGKGRHFCSMLSRMMQYDNQIQAILVLVSFNTKIFIIDANICYKIKYTNPMPVGVHVKNRIK